MIGNSKSNIDSGAAVATTTGGRNFHIKIEITLLNSSTDVRDSYF